MFSALIPVVVIIAACFFAGLLLRRGAGLIRALLGLIRWPLRVALLAVLAVGPAHAQQSNLYGPGCRTDGRLVEAPDRLHFPGPLHSLRSAFEI